MKKPNGKLDIALTDPEVEYLKQIHNARALQELTRQPGWEIYTKFIADIIARLEDLHLSYAFTGQSMASRDSYWASGIRLAGVREFAKILQEQIAKEVSILSQPLRPPTPPDPADLDGDRNIAGES
jgi:hypothetical protein